MASDSPASFLSAETIEELDHLTPEQLTQLRLHLSVSNLDKSKPNGGARARKQLAERPASLVKAINRKTKLRPKEFTSKVQERTCSEWGRQFIKWFNSLFPPGTPWRKPTPLDLCNFCEHFITGQTPSQSREGVTRGISVRYYRCGMDYINQYMVFEDPAWDFTKHHRARINNTITGLVNEGLLYEGLLNPRRRISSVNVIKAITHTLYRNWRYGSLSWDLTLYDCMFVIVLLAMGVRIGDVARSEGYDGDQYLQYRHIQIHFPKNATSIQEATTHITLHYTKGVKNMVDQDLHFLFDPVRTLSACHSDVAAIILGYAMRTGAVNARTEAEVVQLALRSPGRHVPWARPTYPVLHEWKYCEGDAGLEYQQTRCRIALGRHPVYSQPATLSFLRARLARMMVGAGFLGVTPHAVRRGAGADVANHWTNTRDPHAAQTFLGHSNKTTFSGITSNYTRHLVQNEYIQRLDHIAKTGVDPFETNEIDLSISATGKRALPQVYVARHRTGTVQQHSLSESPQSESSFGSPATPASSTTSHASDAAEPHPCREGHFPNGAFPEYNDAEPQMEDALASMDGLDELTKSLEDGDTYAVTEEGEGRTQECTISLLLSQDPYNVPSLPSSSGSSSTKDYDLFTTNYDDPVEQEFRDLFASTSSALSFFATVNRHVLIVTPARLRQLSASEFDSRVSKFSGGSREKLEYVILDAISYHMICPVCWSGHQRGRDSTCPDAFHTRSNGVKWLDARPAWFKHMMSGKVNVIDPTIGTSGHCVQCPLCTGWGGYKDSAIKTYRDHPCYLDGSFTRHDISTQYRRPCRMCDVDLGYNTTLRQFEHHTATAHGTKELWETLDLCLGRLVVTKRNLSTTTPPAGSPDAMSSSNVLSIPNNSPPHTAASMKVCPFCCNAGRRCRFQSSFRDHPCYAQGAFASRSVYFDSRFPCSLCGLRLPPTASLEDLSAHALAVHGVANGWEVLDLVAGELWTPHIPFALDSVTQVRHPGSSRVFKQRSLPCPLCKKYDNGQLEAHECYVNGEIGLWNVKPPRETHCLICQHQWFYERDFSNIMEHASSKHQISEPARVFRIIRGQVTVADPTKLSCPLCAKTVTTLDGHLCSYTGQLTVATVRPFPVVWCKLCGVRFDNQPDFAHVASHFATDHNIFADWKVFEGITGGMVSLLPSRIRVPTELAQSIVVPSPSDAASISSTS